MKEIYNGNLASDITYEIKRASRGENLSITTDQWLERFGLDQEERDGKTLMERFVGDRNIFAMALMMRNVNSTFDGLGELIKKMSNNNTTEQEEQLAKSLTTVAIRQIQREGDICPGASFLVTTTFLMRPHFFPEEMQNEMLERVKQLRDEYDK